MKTFKQYQIEVLNDFRTNPYSFWAKKLDKMVHIPIKNEDGFSKTICGAHGALLGNNYAKFHDDVIDSICPQCMLRSYHYSLWQEFNSNVQFLNENEYKEDEYHGYITKEKRQELLKECRDILDYFLAYKEPERKYFWKDKTGRGESNTFDEADLITTLEDEYSWDDISVIDFIKEAEIGDEWTNSAHHVTRIQ